MERMKATGQYAKIKVTVDGTPVEIMELREWSISGSTEKVDSSVAGDAWSDHEVGRGSWEGSATVLDVDKFWVDYLFTKIDVEFFKHQDDVEPMYKGKVSLDFEQTSPYDDMIESSLTFTGSGELKGGSAVEGA